VVGAVYLVLVTFTTVAANYLEKRYAVPV
jgi:ABC-type amino acid transport system permease subunit